MFKINILFGSKCVLFKIKLLFWNIWSSRTSIYHLHFWYNSTGWKRLSCQYKISTDNFITKTIKSILEKFSSLISKNVVESHWNTKRLLKLAFYFKNLRTPDGTITFLDCIFNKKVYKIKNVSP